MTMADMRLRVNWLECKARGICAEVLPELIELDDWGYPIVAEGTVPNDLVDEARLAVQSCPRLALLLIPEPGR
jgi:ferredoxin